jgi:hypothetical protein
MYPAPQWPSTGGTLPGTVGLPFSQSGPQVDELVVVVVVVVVARPPPPEDPPPPADPPAPAPPDPPVAPVAVPATDPPPSPEPVDVTVEAPADVDELDVVPAPDGACVAGLVAVDVTDRLTVVIVPVPLPAPDPQALTTSAPRTAAHAR